MDRPGPGDRGEAERGALEGAAEVHLAEGVERVFARPGSDVGGADFRRWRAAGVGLLDFTEGLGSGENVCFGAISDSVEVGGETRGIVKLR